MANRKIKTLEEQHAVQDDILKSFGNTSVSKTQKNIQKDIPNQWFLKNMRKKAFDFVVTYNSFSAFKSQASNDQLQAVFDLYNKEKQGGESTALE